MTKVHGRSIGWRKGLVLAGLLGVAAVAIACDKVPLTAPTESKITLFSSATFVPANSSAEITASVIESAGTAVQNGTLVTFTSTVGTIEPREARTNGGKVTVKLVAGAVSGKAQIRAFSGSAQSDAIEVAIGGAAVESLLLSASPSTVPASGGSIEIVAVVLDASGNRISGVPVSFSASTGVVSPTSATSNDNGEARSRLTTNVASDISASAGAKTATTKVTVSNAPVVRVTLSPTSTRVGQAVNATVDINASATGATPLRSAVIDWGDGSSQGLSVAAGAVSASETVGHVYRGSGSFTVRVVAIDVIGQQGASSAAVFVDALAPLIVSVTSSGTQRVKIPITFTAAFTPSDAVPSSFVWDFGDGTTRTAAAATTHVFDRVGQRTVSVTVTTVDGRVGRGTTEVIIEP